MAHRCRRVLHQFARAERQLAQLQRDGHFQRLAQRLSQRHLRVLVTLAETHNERQAARRLALTQPTVSASLRDLEGRLATPLFLRTQRGLVHEHVSYVLRDKQHQSEAAVLKAQDEILGPLDADERETLCRLLQRIADENNDLSRVPLKHVG